MMDRRRGRSPGARKRRSSAHGWVGAEIELMLHEHERLLRTAGAAASLLSTLDPRALPSRARRSLMRLGATLAHLSDETLADAMEQVLAAQRASARRSLS